MRVGMCGKGDATTPGFHCRLAKSTRGFRSHLWPYRSAFLLSVCVGGCAQSPQPRAPNLDQNHLIIVGEQANNSSVSVINITQARRMVDGLTHELYEASESRRNTEEKFNDATFFGTLVAVAGIATDSIAARNIGAGVAGLSSTVSGHYQPRAQIIAFKKALAQARCLRSALNGIDETAYDLFPDHKLGNVDKIDAENEFAKIPQITFDRVGDIAVDLTNNLDEINTASPNLSDIKTIALAVSDAATAAAKTPKQASASVPPSVLDLKRKSVQQAQASLDSAKESYVNNLRANNIQAFDGSGALKNPYSERLVTKTARLELDLSAAKADLADASALAGEEIARKTAFLSGVVQYAASAEACVKLSSSD